MIDTLSPSEDINTIISNAPCCVIEFGDAACGPCLAIRERLGHWVEEHSATGIEARYVPVADFSELAAQMGVFTAPAVRVYIDGNLAVDVSGYFSLDRMLERVERYLKMVSG